jgi:anaerobic magnesium-protoporphyrin IX monomethyl ester cyclase
MARVALVKLFTGLNLGVSQLSGELQRAGHESLIVYFKDFLAVPVEEAHRYLVTDYAGIAVSARAKELVWNAYKPFSEREYQLLVDTLREFRPDLIGFSLTALTLKPAAEVTARLKQHLDVPVIWGGAGPTLEPDWCLEHADLVCHGEGEELIVQLAARLDTGADYSDIPGLWLTRSGTVIKNPDAPLPDLEAIAVPDFEPSRTIHINDDQLRRNVYPHNLGKQYVIMTQRGCPFSCAFCVESVYQDMWGKKSSLRRRSVDVVIQELVEAKQRFDVNQVMFYDDVFTVNPRWLREFATRYKAEVGLPFWAYTYPTTTRREDLLLLKDAGLRSITMGIQSGSDEILRRDFNRPVGQEKAYEAARIIAECGLQGFFDLITKVHFEKEEHLRETFEFLLDFPREMQSVGFGHMTSFPNYGYTRKVEAEGATVSVSDRDYHFYHKLYFLTRTSLPRPLVRAIGKSRIMRRFPNLIDPLLPKSLPAFFLTDDEGEYADEIVNLPHATAVIPGGRLDRGLDGPETRSQS